MNTSKNPKTINKLEAMVTGKSKPQTKLIKIARQTLYDQITTNQSRFGNN